MNNIRESAERSSPRQSAKQHSESRSTFTHHRPWNSNIELPNRLPGRSYHFTNRFGMTGNPKFGELIQIFVAKRRKSGILDQIQTSESREAASLLWHEFLDSANAVSQKTINQATRLLETLDFPLP
jgi:hypothetical protein